MNKIIYAKATVKGLCAILVYKNGAFLAIGDVIKSCDIAGFIHDVGELARKHHPWMVQYECTVYTNECKDLRKLLTGDNIPVRGYKSEGLYLDRIVSQAGWIEKHVMIDDRFTDFIDRMTSFNADDTDKDNIEMDVLSDAVIFMRRYFG
jgi:hypothetical protein